MTALLNKYKRPLLFVLALAPIAIVGGFFTGVYGWAELTDDVKSQILAQIGNNQGQFYLISTLQTLTYTLILGFFGYILSVKTVSSVQEAIDHINRYHTGHSDCIITENREAAEAFLKQVDSACVYVNVSTRFTDGFEFGFGAEIGISTQKLHARGPMGLAELTSYKYLIEGEGQVRG